ncbi:MAG: hypothetical protein V7K41_22285 [Nostoc sp.]|uniref:hypothetical protein n=1 Tax=Nostoc sp. TaxID=1180 RepID=UPI002FF6DC93
MSQIKDLGIEKLEPNNNDILPIQQADGVTNHITRKNFLKGVFNNSSNSAFIQLLDKKPSGTNGGFAVTSQWSTRIINTIQYDDTGLVVLKNNLFKLPSGTYELEGDFTFYAMSDIKLRLQNTTDDVTFLYGINAYFQASTNGAALQMPIKGKFTIEENKYLAIQYWAKPASVISQYNFGGSVSDGSPEIYALLNIKKI